MSDADHVRYIDKTREYYQGEGYDRPSRWIAFSQYSQRETLGLDSPKILEWLREDRVDVAVLTAL
jgi:hypothetical protein